MKRKRSQGKEELGGLHNAPVFLYDKHMPKTDDLTLIVLKGHLLIEETLLQLADAVLPHPEYLDDANLSFHKLACVVRASVPQRSTDVTWQLILSVNALRNDLAHNLESSQSPESLNKLFSIAQQVERLPWSQVAMMEESPLDDAARLRHVIMDCMEFLLRLTFEGSYLVRGK